MDQTNDIAIPSSDAEKSTPTDRKPKGAFEARYLAFLDTVTDLRPKLHRYCARMTGSIFEGEDVVQDALLEAYRKLEQFDDSRPLSPWLFRIAHNRCIDLLRRRGAAREAAAKAGRPVATMPAEPASLGVGKAVEQRAEPESEGVRNAVVGKA